ncbi:hypothetical protein CXF85_15225 [Colwellia sp. 75C3]|nr:hypothetical protein CXF85_15225 [Colwellia sp. 75C3]
MSIMKVLLLGEFSALHKNLAEGLSHLGIDVTTASSGDGTKAISSDLSWAGKRVGKAGKIERLFNLSKVYKEFKGYDVVQLISPCIFPKELGINKRIMKYVINNNKKIYLVGAGGSTVNTILANFFRNSYKYPQLYQEIVKKTGDKWCFSPTGRRFNKYLHDSITGYIPIMYEYAEPYRELRIQSYVKLFLFQLILILLNMSQI